MKDFITCEHAADYVTAEQHAIDNPGHVVLVTFNTDGLIIDCRDCEWWDQQL
jgi:3,4-dihydroxy-2-butanone 4-phosphate synthase